MQLASERLKGDKVVVMEAVKNNGLALEYAIPPALNDKVVVTAALKQNWKAIEFVPEEFLAYTEFMIPVVE